MRTPSAEGVPVPPLTTANPVPCHHGATGGASQGRHPRPSACADGPGRRLPCGRPPGRQRRHGRARARGLLRRAVISFLGARRRRADPVDPVHGRVGVVLPHASPGAASVSVMPITGGWQHPACAGTDQRRAPQGGRPTLGVGGTRRVPPPPGPWSHGLTGPVRVRSEARLESGLFERALRERAQAAERSSRRRVSLSPLESYQLETHLINMRGIWAGSTHP